jgi:hypothetical protein
VVDRYRPNAGRILDVPRALRAAAQAAALTYNHAKGGRSPASASRAL